MNSPVNPLLLLSVLMAAALLAVWLHARRRRARKIVERMHDQLAAPAARVQEHIRNPPPIVPLSSGAVLGSERRSGSEPMELLPGGAVVTSLIPSPAADGGRTLTDMLEGIELPYDLMPVMSVVEDPNRHIVFLTTHSNAGEVGKQFADELERLGFEMQPVEFDQAVAVRGGDVVSMKIVPDAAGVDTEGSGRYGAAGPGDVALETWIGRSPVPPSTLE